MLNKISCLHGKMGNLRMSKYQAKSLHLNKSGNMIRDISFIHFILSFTILGTGVRMLR